MPRIRYQTITFNETKQALVDQAAEIIADYRRQGYRLTLRQLYYRFVAGDLLPASWADPKTGSTNNERSYKKLGDIIADARLGGYIDWTAIEDRTRELDGNNHWDSPTDIIQACAQSFMLDKWADQKYRVEVWVEKDALEGIIGQTARDLDIDFFSCRGYASATALWDAGQRLKRYAVTGQIPVILHLGDHDPSGLDMSRDVEERVGMFMDGQRLRFERLALNMDQIEELNPPPNPAKVTDSRADKYIEEYGESCWELDALEPAYIDNLVRTAVAKYRDDGKFGAKKDEENEHKENIGKVADNWEAAVRAVDETEE